MGIQQNQINYCLELPKFLLIESSGDVCSAAVSSGTEIIAEKSIQEKNSHSTYLASFVEEVMKNSGLQISDLDAVVIGGGPGSYTGLRIGCSLAKGLCFGADIPLIACSTLKALAAAALEQNQDVDRVITLVDARRMDAYLGVFDKQLNTLVDEQFITIDAQLSVDYTKGQTIACGSGAEKWFDEFSPKGIVQHSYSGIYANNLVLEALIKWEQKDFVDVAYYEPNYIKSVFVTKPKPKF
ncbi:MAG: tRNA threonylcarbamoyladenosine biosynthesis protein TsaB [Pseudoalteromonas distincta]